MAAERGMTSTIEPTPTLTINGLGAAVAAVRHVGRPDFGLLLDTMHLGRTGVTGAEVAAAGVPPAVRVGQCVTAMRRLLGDSVHEPLT